MTQLVTIQRFSWDFATQERKGGRTKTVKKMVCVPKFQKVYSGVAAQPVKTKTERGGGLNKVEYSDCPRIFWMVGFRLSIQPSV